MSNTAALLGLGEMRRRQEASKARGQRYLVDPAVREARAKVQEAREALHDQQQAEAKAEQDASPNALRAVLSRGSIDELAEIARMIGRLDGRRLQTIADEVFRERGRNGYQPDSQGPQEAAPVPKASSARRTR